MAVSLELLYWGRGITLRRLPWCGPLSGGMVVGVGSGEQGLVSEAGDGGGGGGRGGGGERSGWSWALYAVYQGRSKRNCQQRGRVGSGVGVVATKVGWMMRGKRGSGARA